MGQGQAARCVENERRNETDPGDPVHLAHEAAPLNGEDNLGLELWMLARLSRVSRRPQCGMGSLGRSLALAWKPSIASWTSQTLSIAASRSR